jgi:hypothetical protein
MDFVIMLFKFLSVIAVIFLLIGFYKPWVMLWWEDIQTRKKVLKVYGSTAVISYVIYWTLILIK